MAAPTKSARLSVAIERTGKWVFSQDVPSDVVVEVGEANFCLHKFMLVAKSGYVRKLIVQCPETDLSRIELPDIPGGPEAFEKAAKFCYGANFDITVRNVAALRCAAEYLEMSEKFGEGNLVVRTEEFLTHAALTTFSGAIAVLKSCEELMPMAEDVKIVQRSVEAASLKAFNESTFQTRSPPGWWIEELSILPIDFFKRFLVSLKSRGARTQILATTIMAYAERSLRDLVSDRTSCSSRVIVGGSDRRRRQKETLEGLVETLPDERTAFPAGFLCCLLRAAIFLGCAQPTRSDLERRVAAVLEHAAIDDLLAVSMGDDVDHDSVKRIVAAFAERERRGIGDVASPAAKRVAKAVDAYLAEIATDPHLSISKFTGLAVLLPKSARKYDDDLYRAADIYLKAHPGLDEIDREKVCSIMDPLNLSNDARMHASENKRLPVQVVLHALYFDQLKLRCEGPKILDASIVRNQVNADVSMMKENEVLRKELAKMKAAIADMHKNQQGSSSSTTKSSRRPFFASISKTIGKLNPFRQGSKDTLQIETATCGSIDIAKPRKRRFSIS